jgi:hypothetical protein
VSIDHTATLDQLVVQRSFCGLFVSLVYCAESTVRWFVVREKHCWMTADSADKSKRTGRWILDPSLEMHPIGSPGQDEAMTPSQPRLACF